MRSIRWWAWPLITLVCGTGLFCPMSWAESSEGTEAGATRTANGLVVLYDFRNVDGAVIPDRSGLSNPINLKIADLKQVKRSPGRLELVGETRIASVESAARLTEVVRRTGELTIEAWLEPAQLRQEGPARIVTLSRDANQRNFTLGQDGRRFDVRLRHTSSSDNGIPSLASPEKSVVADLIHVCYTRDRSGRTRIYLDGKLSAEDDVNGMLMNWNHEFQLGLGNEISGGRPWLGAYRLVAIYSRDLPPHEVRRHFLAGPDADTTREERQAATLSPRERHFRDHVAGILARHCLECHDTPVREGGLDLSRKSGLEKGSENGPVLVAGHPDRSRLWETVDTDEMPLDRPPLSKEEKEALRKWIEEGAAWPVDVIDPTLYAHEARTEQTWVRRLTVPEYIATVKAAVGVDITEEAHEQLPRDLRADGFSNTAYNLNVDFGHVEAYARLAEIIVTRMDAGQFAAQFSQSRKLTDDDMRELIARMGQWVLRGPLSEYEIVSYRGISTTVASAGGNFDDAVRYIVQAMLQSPRFLYRIENQVGDGTVWPVGPYELAARMSYILWGAPPDKQLWKLAESSDLYDDDIIRRQIQRMLDDPRAVERSKQFVSQWLNLERLRNLAPSRDHFPDWDPQLAEDMREETLSFFEEVCWEQRRPLHELLNAQLTFVTPRLAKHYRLPDLPPAGGRYDLNSVPGRGGLLTQGSVLTIGGDNASMVTRGLFVLHDLLRGAVKDPPPCVDTTPVPTKPGLTQRAIAEARIADSSCGGCHAKFEPLAFGLEKFDGLGAYHETDRHGNTLRDDGEILIPGTAEPIPYRSAAELMDLLAESERVRQSLTWKVTQFALGRPLSAADAPIVVRIHEQAQQSGGSYADVMTAIVLSDLVQMTQTEPIP